MGKEENTAFVIYSHQACDRKVEELISLLSHFEIRGEKSSFFGFVRPSGNPK
jgi:hypothetical protein